MLSELKKFKIYLFAKSITSDSDIKEAFKSMHESIITKIINYASEDCIALDEIIKHSIKISKR